MYLNLASRTFLLAVFHNYVSHAFTHCILHACDHWHWPSLANTISPFAAPMCSIVNLRMLLSTRFFGGFTIPWGPWRNSTWLSSGRPWAIGWICKLVPPLLKHLFSSISWQLSIISSQKWCLHMYMFSWSKNVFWWICIYVYTNEGRHYRKT